ncbi:MAG: type II toxin-antitoxin system RelE/ParE family toxin [Burkholderiaceae bacterium]|nr:type II toxin-antitoxin system RelE/ParE family toxin [Burkholderiaceae bacterium]
MSTVRVDVHPAAIDEARAAYAWYAERNENAANEFMAEVDRAVGLIAANPDRWPAYRFGTRRILLRRFPFSLIFRHDKEAVTVFAVTHARRRPAYWRHRL